mgnify:CR=1 FL=1
MLIAFISSCNTNDSSFMVNPMCSVCKTIHNTRNKKKLPFRVAKQVTYTFKTVPVNFYAYYGPLLMFPVHMRAYRSSLSPISLC